MTEKIDRKFKDFDIWNTTDMVAAIYEDQVNALLALKNTTEDIALAVDEAAARLGEAGRLIYVGAGTSGRLAVQDGTELHPTFGWPMQRMVFCIAGGPSALMRSVEGAEDITEKCAKEMLEAEVGPNDVVICVAASGQTPFYFRSLKTGKKLRCINNRHCK